MWNACKTRIYNDKYGYKIVSQQQYVNDTNKPIF